MTETPKDATWDTLPARASDAAARRYPGKLTKARRAALAAGVSAGIDETLRTRGLPASQATTHVQSVAADPAARAALARLHELAVRRRPRTKDGSISRELADAILAESAIVLNPPAP